MAKVDAKNSYLLLLLLLLLLFVNSINTLMGEEGIWILILFYERDFAMLLDYKSHTFIYRIAKNGKITMNCYYWCNCGLLDRCDINQYYLMQLI